ncbi:MAG: DUF3311 domain-containing protein [Acidobacteria bacterium]|nr:DUF3311 domain-containing protein [Acidobacteriota bacterium]
MPRRLVYLALIALAILHQDFFFADDATIVLGFLPIGLAYHALYCVATAVVWLLAIRYAWPHELVAFARGDDPPRREE